MNSPSKWKYLLNICIPQNEHFLSNTAVSQFAEVTSVEQSRKEHSDSFGPLPFKAANQGMKSKEARLLLLLLLCVCVCVLETGPFPYCFPIGGCWSRPVPHQFKTKSRLTSDTPCTHTHTHTRWLSFRQSRNPSFPLVFLLLPHFVFWEGRSEARPLSAFHPLSPGATPSSTVLFWHKHYLIFEEMTVLLLRSEWQKYTLNHNHLFRAIFQKFNQDENIS